MVMRANILWVLRRICAVSFSRRVLVVCGALPLLLVALTVHYNELAWDAYTRHLCC